MLPVLQRPLQQRTVRGAHAQRTVLLLDPEITEPPVAPGAGIAGQRQRGLRSGHARIQPRLPGRGRLVPHLVRSRRIGTDPVVALLRLQVGIQDLQGQRIERATGLLVGQHHDAQIVAGHQGRARDHARPATGMPHQLLSAIGRGDPAQAVAEEIRYRRRQFRHRRLGDVHRRMQRPHVLVPLGREQALRLAAGIDIGAPCQLRLHPARHVMGAGVDPAGAGGVVPGQREGRLQGGEIGLGMAGGGTVAAAQRVGVEARAGHAQRGEEALLQEVGIGLARDLFDQRRGHRVEDVVVGVTLAHAALERNVLQPPHHLGVAVIAARPEQQVAGAQAQAAVVGQQVAHAHLRGDPGVGHAEARQVFDHLVFQRQPALVGQHRQRGGGEGLGVGSDRTQGVCVHLAGLAQLAHAPAAFEHDLAVLDHGHRDPGHLEALAHLFDPGLQLRRIQRGRRRGGNRLRRPRPRPIQGDGRQGRQRAQADGKQAAKATRRKGQGHAGRSGMAKPRF